MIRSNLCDYSEVYIHFEANITVPNTAAADEPVNITNKTVIFKNCQPFPNCISEINNTQLDGVHDIDVVYPMYNLIEYSDVDFPANNNNSISFKFKQHKQDITGQTGNRGTNVAEIMVPLKYLGSSGRTLEMTLINCKVILQLKWSK